MRCPPARPCHAARLLLPCVLVVLAGFGLTARAERADRQAPLAFTADTARVDDQKAVHTLSGNVEITKGSIVIKAAQVEVRQGKDGHQIAVASGGAKRATFRQKREGLEEFIEGEAERLEYDSRADAVKLVGQAVMRRLRGSTVADEVNGSVITYDNTSEVFQVQGGATAGGGTGRVRGVLTPRETPAAGAGR